MLEDTPQLGKLFHVHTTLLEQEAQLYRRGTARHVISVEILSTACCTAVRKKIPFKKLAIGE